MRALLLIATVVATATAALAQPTDPQQIAADPSGIAVQQAWARATPGTLTTGAAYFTVANMGSEPDRLLSVSTEVADKASLHEDKMEGGMMTMRPLGPIAVAPGQSVVLKPGGDHLMLEGLRHPLKEGEHFALTLTFEKAGEKKIDVAVGKAAAMGPPSGTMGDTMGGMEMGGMTMPH